jgi:hypothetical protein
MRASSPRRITARACQSLPSRFTRGRSPSIEGMARRKAQTYGSAILSDHGGRLSARHMCSSSKAVAHVICDVGRQQAPLLPEVGFAASERQLAPSRTSYWVRENPATAREPDCASAGPHAPHLVPPSQRLARAPVNWTRCVQFKRSLEGGDKLARPSRSFPSSRPCAGHPRFSCLATGKSWMAGP